MPAKKWGPNWFRTMGADCIGNKSRATVSISQYKLLFERDIMFHVLKSFHGAIRRDDAVGEPCHTDICFPATRVPVGKYVLEDVREALPRVRFEIRRP